VADLARAAAAAASSSGGGGWVVGGRGLVPAQAEHKAVCMLTATAAMPTPAPARPPTAEVGGRGGWVPLPRLPCSRLPWSRLPGAVPTPTPTPAPCHPVAGMGAVGDAVAAAAAASAAAIGGSGEMAGLRARLVHAEHMLRNRCAGAWMHAGAPPPLMPLRVLGHVGRGLKRLQGIGRDWTRLPQILPLMPLVTNRLCLLPRPMRLGTKVGAPAATIPLAVLHLLFALGGGHSLCYYPTVHTLCLHGTPPRRICFNSPRWPKHVF
jgi:hypothetical protein